MFKLIQYLQTKQRENRFFNALEKSKQWEVSRKGEHAKGGKLDPAVNALINVESNLYNLYQLSGKDDYQPSISWNEVKVSIGEEMGKILIDQSLADRQNNPHQEK